MKDLVEENAYTVCEAVIAEIEDKTGVEIDKDIIQSVIASVMLGVVYPGKWTFDKVSEKSIEHLDTLITQVIEAGLNQGKSVDEIVADVVAVMTPDATHQKSFTVNGNTVYVERIDGNAQRLAKTVFEHIFQQCLVESAVEISKQLDKRVMIRWVSALTESTCEVCESRHNKLYEPLDLPLEHPNGLCDFFIEIH